MYIYALVYICIYIISFLYKKKLVQRIWTTKSKQRMTKKKMTKEKWKNDKKFEWQKIWTTKSKQSILVVSQDKSIAWRRYSFWYYFPLKSHQKKAFFIWPLKENIKYKKINIK